MTWNNDSKFSDIIKVPNDKKCVDKNNQDEIDSKLSKLTTDLEWLEMLEVLYFDFCYLYTIFFIFS